MITWHCGPDGLAIYRDGVLSGVIPIDKFPRLIFDLAAVLTDASKAKRHLKETTPNLPPERISPCANC